MISVANLTKRYGRVTAVDNLSFEVKQGEIVGFLGPNGAGKTTTMRILSTFLPATGGTVRICGFDVFTESLEVRRRIGYLPETVPLYPDMRVSEYLLFRGRLKGLRGSRLHARLDEVVETCGLADVRRAIIGRLSKGYMQRVGLADALIHDPHVLVLDEPTIGLDPNQIRNIRGLIQSLGRRHTVLLSSHILSEVQMICERVLILNAGRVVAADRTDNLVGLMKAAPRVWMEVQGPLEAILLAVRSVPGVRGAAGRPAGDWNQIACDCESGLDLRAELSRAVAAGGWVAREIRAEQRNLEDVFAELTAANDGASGQAGAEGSGA
jgi:ABC-2 type transport system ATP-binding protein